MANAKIIINTQIKGGAQLDKLQRNLKAVSRESKLAAARLNSLQTAAARGRASFQALATTLKVGVAAGLGAVAFGIGKFVKDTFSAGKLTESLQVRFKLLFNSAEEGARAFDVLNKFASKVPFSLEAIAAGSGNLAVIADDADDLSRVLEVTGNVAAATGLDFRQTAEQIQRAFAGGIAAADVFRERGVRAMLGFEAGAKVSIEETRKRFFEVFSNGGQFSTATKDFEETLEAQVSFVEDAYFRFRQAAAQPLFAGVKAQLVELVGNFKNNEAELKKLAQSFGETLASAFGTLGKIIKTLVANFDLLTKAFKIMIGLKIASTFVNMGAAIAQSVVGIRAATGAMGVFNAVVRANPIGLVITVLQGAVIAFIAFEDQILQLVDTIKNYFVREIKLAAKNVLELISKLKIFPKFSKNAAEGAKEIAKELEQMKFEASDAYKEMQRLSKIKKFSDTKIDVSAPMIMGRAQAKALEKEKKAEQKAIADEAIRQGDLQALTSKRLYQMDVQRILKQREAIAEVKTYRQVLSEVGIESKNIGATLGQTWVDGINQGNSLLQITKDSFRNILVSISESMVKKSAELLVEQLFLRYADQKIIKQKQLNAEVSNQGSLMSGLVSKSKGILSSLGGLFGGGSKGGGFLSSGAAGGASLGGGGGKWGTLFNLGRSFLGFNQGGLVPGGAPYTDRIPAMLTPGEMVVPRNKVKDNSMGSTNITNINISGNVDQRSIDQIKAVISTAQAEVGGANRSYSANTKGIRGRNI